jgi:hypothetical protein
MKIAARDLLRHALGVSLLCGGLCAVSPGCGPGLVPPSAATSGSFAGNKSTAFDAGVASDNPSGRGGSGAVLQPPSANAGRTGSAGAAGAGGAAGAPGMDLDAGTEDAGVEP